MNIDDFVLLLLARLSKSPKMIDLNGKNNVIVSIPSNYKDIIENILTSNEKWRSEFSVLIDMNEYFNDHYEWEKKLAVSLEKILTVLEKKLDYNLKTEMLEISFSKSEMDAILSEMNDEHLSSVMDHFVFLLHDFSYSRDYRRFKEKNDAVVLHMKKLFGSNN